MTRVGPAGNTARGLALTVLTVLTGALLLLSASPARAHAQLVGTDPAEGAVLTEAPGEITLTFSEPVRLTARRVTLYDAAATVVDSSAAASGEGVTLRPAEALGEGTYLVSWAVVSQDGHPISGTLTFSVGSRSPVLVPPPPMGSADAMTADRGLLAGATYLGLLGAGGLVAFALLALPRAAPAAARRRVRLLARGGAVVAVVGAWVQVPLASAYAQGAGWAGLTSTFDAGLVRNELAVAVAVTVGLGTAVGSLTDSVPARRWTALLGVLVAVCAPALAGHSRSYGPAALVLGADALHLVAAALWFGGLLGLVATLRPVDDATSAATTLARFSGVAGGLLVVVAAVGAVLGWRILGSWDGLVGTTYGVLLLTKVGLVLVVAGAAGWNRFRLLPRVQGAQPGRALALVRRTVALEAALLVVVLGVTGFLVNQPPTDLPEPPPAPEPVAETLALGELEVVVGLTPGGTGGNTLSLRVQAADGTAVEPPRAPRVTLASEEFDLGTLALRRVGRGSYEALVPIPRGGTWRLQVGLRLSRFENPVAAVDFEVP